MKTLDDLLKQPGAWLNVGGNTGVLVSSRVRLARNIEGEAFPGWAGEEESVRLWNELRPVIESLPGLSSPLVLEIADLSCVDRDVLIERHLMSRDLAGKGRGSGLILKRDESMAVMLNEEDHLRMQVMSPGLKVMQCWQEINALDTEIESRIAYAFSPRLGYLTACPTNVGTGMRASVMLHLPGLVLMNEINGIIKGVSKIGLVVRGLWGEGTDASGNMFQISNQVTLGEKEAAIIERLEKIVLEIAEHEKNARARLIQQRETSLRDHIGRAFGIMSQAYLLNSKETLDLLSALRLGIDLGLVTDWPKAVIDELFVLIQPGHLQKWEGKAIGAEKRDLARARLVRERLAERRRKTG
ncbi:MAG: protein arginine kinase [Verrucomicrobia bacterium]|nr:protein arginine kinase [Verrucomicrobiota bacterium]MCG2679740.1 protein arginine kinase [Kiritimatiellia bacterium]MBU4248578.1 protein arginine kinase [Verrucomicrobiota bacterium]MBU4291552.1 protein arginine kinase [Verrucomicrobiota bacterium]MBU4430435.1 protein arginine kinase [Verrucomicrobiota bacterium]